MTFAQLSGPNDRSGLVRAELSCEMLDRELEVHSHVPDERRGMSRAVQVRSARSNARPPLSLKSERY